MDLSRCQLVPGALPLSLSLSLCIYLSLLSATLFVKDKRDLSPLLARLLCILVCAFLFLFMYVQVWQTSLSFYLYFSFEYTSLFLSVQSVSFSLFVFACNLIHCLLASSLTC